MSSSNLSRRAILAGVSAMPGLTLSGLALAAPSADAERRLFEIESKILELEDPARLCEIDAGKRCDAREEWERSNPMPQVESKDALAVNADFEAALAQYEDARTLTLADLFEIGQASIDRYRESMEQWHARREAAIEHHFGARDDTVRSPIDQIYDLCDEATNIRAMTMAGLLSKARLINVLSKLKEWHGPLAVGLAQNLLALSVGA